MQFLDDDIQHVDSTCSQEDAVALVWARRHSLRFVLVAMPDIDADSSDTMIPREVRDVLTKALQTGSQEKRTVLMGTCSQAVRFLELLVGADDV